jgi:hypothetical protein
MPLDINSLKNGIKSLHDDMMTREVDSNQDFAERMSTLIHDFVVSATVTVAIGIPVSTAGTATSQTGATTSTGTATIS